MKYFELIITDCDNKTKQHGHIQLTNTMLDKPVNNGIRKGVMEFSCC